eukprot:9467782-Pyramimonas_sp.AAC.1
MGDSTYKDIKTSQRQQDIKTEGEEREAHGSRRTRGILGEEADAAARRMAGEQELRRWRKSGEVGQQREDEDEHEELEGRQQEGDREDGLVVAAIAVVVAKPLPLPIARHLTIAAAATLPSHYRCRGRGRYIGRAVA